MQDIQTLSETITALMKLQLQLGRRRLEAIDANEDMGFRSGLLFAIDRIGEEVVTLQRAQIRKITAAVNRTE